jgi:hypothetical protein
VSAWMRRSSGVISDDHLGSVLWNSVYAESYPGANPTTSI